MADTKISALTGATTPLAGTEVLPIVQSGTTVKVSVANLTAGRAIDATTGTFTGLLTSSTGPATVSTQQGGLKSFCPGFSGQYGGIFFSTPSASIDQIEADIFTSGNTGVPSSKLKVLKDGDVNVLLGNLVIGTSGKGIDFSSTAGTGTSELLNDYEEGTWTPIQGANVTLVGSFSSSGTYTKIGRSVTVAGQINGSTSVSVIAAGILVSGLPFTVGTVSLGGSTNASLNVSEGVLATSTVIYATSAIAATTTIFFSVTYQV